MRTRATIVVGLVAAFSILSAAEQAIAEALPVGPSAGDQDLSPFYRWTGKLPSRPGLMLREEPLPANPQIANAGQALRILYTSTDARWNSGVLPVSGTLHLPGGARPRGGWPLVAWAHGTLGVADKCAPSWAGHRPRDAAYINEWLKQGFAVVSTDYQGLGGPGPHPYTVWQAEGRSVLDGIRAATSAHRREIANVVVITGQSQGSGAAIGATRLQPTYAPDVGLKASIATGVLSSFSAPDASPPPAPAQGSAYYTMLSIAGAGLREGAPPRDELLTEKGRMLLNAALGGCDARAIEQREGVTAANAFRAPDQIRDYTLRTADMSPVRMRVPVFLGTGLADSLLVPRRQYAAARALCGAGSHIVWKTYPGATHNGGMHAALKDEFAFVDAVLRGEPEPSNCSGIADPGEPARPQPGLPYN
ncbi:alpha/beta hydrolase [Phenylobacterium sp.]|jgi:hypothetical protein|uniref:alpha/beta hydrolase n=1 Tax=Phenylobacterium sp. TaxID=1871053 RepID=UPI002F921B4C